MCCPGGQGPGRARIRSRSRRCCRRLAAEPRIRSVGHIEAGFQAGTPDPGGQGIAKAVAEVVTVLHADVLS